MIARFGGRCHVCSRRYPAETRIEADSDGRWVHEGCLRDEAFGDLLDAYRRGIAVGKERASARLLDEALLRRAVALAHPDRHPDERADEANEVTGRLLELLAEARRPG